MKLLITPEARRQFAARPSVIQERVRDVSDRLLKWRNVSGAKPLRRELKSYFRIRTGDWRVIFRPVGDDIVISHIENHED